MPATLVRQLQVNHVQGDPRCRDKAVYGIRMLTATALLFFLPCGAPACPDPWDPWPQPANLLEWGSRCLLISVSGRAYGGARRTCTGTCAHVHVQSADVGRALWTPLARSRSDIL